MSVLRYFDADLDGELASCSHLVATKSKLEISYDYLVQNIIVPPTHITNRKTGYSARPFLATNSKRTRRSSKRSQPLSLSAWSIRTRENASGLGMMGSASITRAGRGNVSWRAIEARSKEKARV